MPAPAQTSPRTRPSCCANWRPRSPWGRGVFGPQLPTAGLAVSAMGACEIKAPFVSRFCIESRTCQWQSLATLSSHTHTHERICSHTCMCILMHACTHVYTFMNEYTHVCSHTYTHTNTQAHTRAPNSRMRAHIHRHTRDTHERICPHTCMYILVHVCTHVHT